MDIRDEIISALKREIVGPALNPEYKDETTSEEVLLKFVHGAPSSRYGAGMLYPQACINEEISEEGKSNSGEEQPNENDHDLNETNNQRRQGIKTRDSHLPGSPMQEILEIVRSEGRRVNVGDG